MTTTPRRRKRARPAPKPGCRPFQVENASTASLTTITLYASQLEPRVSLHAYVRRLLDAEAARITALQKGSQP